MTKRLFIILLCLCLFGCFQSDEEKAISLVKDGYLNFDKSITVGAAFSNNSNLSGGKWSSFTSEMGRRVVEFEAVVDDKNIPEEELQFAISNSISSKIIVQFIINQDDTFDVSYVGGILSAPDEFTGKFDEEYFNKYFSKGWKSSIENSIKAIYGNDISRDTSYALMNLEKEIKSIKEDKLYAFVKSQAFDYKEAGLPFRATLVVKILENTDSGALLGYDFKNGWGHIFASNTINNGATCSFFEKYNVDDNRVVLKNDKCPALITFNEGATVITINNTADCGFCGVGGSLDGEYKLIAGASFFLSKGSGGEAYASMTGLTQY